MAISDDKVRVTITIPKTLKEDIQNLAEKDMRSFSQYITVKMTEIVGQELGSKDSKTL